MLYFLIPLRSKQSSKNWEQVERLFNATLASVFNQTDPAFRVIVACHEKPELDRTYDDRLSFIQATYPPPMVTSQHLTDKFYKKRLLVNQALVSGASYIMFVDADDYISRRIATWVNVHCHVSGWFIRTGYEYNISAGTVRVTPNFNHICGTSAILNISDLKAPIDTCFTDYERKDEYLFDFGHNEWLEMLARSGKPPLDAIPFKGAVYVLNTGENWTNASGQKIGIFRRLYRNVVPGMKPGKKLRQEFALHI